MRSDRPRSRIVRRWCGVVACCCSRSAAGAVATPTTPIAAAADATAATLDALCGLRPTGSRAAPRRSRHRNSRRGDGGRAGAQEVGTVERRWEHRRVLKAAGGAHVAKAAQVMPADRRRALRCGHRDYGGHVAPQAALDGKGRPPRKLRAARSAAAAARRVSGGRRAHAELPAAVVAAACGQHGEQRRRRDDGSDVVRHGHSSDRESRKK